MPITKTSQISTKNGDQGISTNFVNESFSKDHILFEVLGVMDELSSFLGLNYHYVKNENILIIQRKIQDINSLIATNPNHQLYKKLRPVEQADITLFEEEMEKMLKERPLEPYFYLPGSDTSLAGAYIDVARALSRKAERALVHFVKEEERKDLGLALVYMNRLSDYLFVFARFLSEN